MVQIMNDKEVLDLLGEMKDYWIPSHDALFGCAWYHPVTDRHVYLEDIVVLLKKNERDIKWNLAMKEEEIKANSPQIEEIFNQLSPLKKKIGIG